VIDPITRIEGHRRVEVDLDADNVSRNAVSTGTMWRGLEVILKGRDSRDAWAFAQRICGVCTGTHALTSVRTVEDALAIEIPENANTIRDMMQLAQDVQDDLIQFYHPHALDWADVVSALRADPQVTSALQPSLSPWPLSSLGYFRDLQHRLQRFVDSGQLGPFRNGYWGHPAYRLPPEANLLAVAHYLEVLDFHNAIAKVHTIFGGKNPHPSWLVGGVPAPLNLDGVGAVDGAAGATNAAPPPTRPDAPAADLSRRLIEAFRARDLLLGVERIEAMARRLALELTTALDLAPTPGIAGPVLQAAHGARAAIGLAATLIAAVGDLLDAFARAVACSPALPRARLTAVGPTPAPPLVARVWAAPARLLGELAPALTALGPAVKAAPAAEPLVDGGGEARSTTHRGVLTHDVDVVSGRIERVTRTTPTDRRFATDGPTRRALAALDRRLLARADLVLVMCALDPCVPWSIEDGVDA